MSDLENAARQYLENTATLNELEVMYGLDQATIKGYANQIRKRK